MRKKESLLKRHPIIPSIFFLLFAWVLLYLITGFKDPEKSNQLFLSNNTTDLNIKGPNEDWNLEISHKAIRFFLKKEHQTFTYPYVEPNDTQDATSGLLKVYQSQTEESQIKIILLKKGESNVCDVIVEKDGNYFYTSGTF